MTVRVLFVCLGNICRSPTAEGVFRAQLAERGLEEQIEVDSAGTSDWHINEAPDRRTVAAALRRGYDLSALRGRQVRADDFYDFDYVLAMDSANLQTLKKLQPSDGKAHLALLLDYAPELSEREVPDPYNGGPQGFEYVLDLVEQACARLLSEILERL